MDGQNESLKYDFARIGRLQLCAEWKAEADRLFESHDFESARALYSKALEAEPTFLAYECNTELPWCRSIDLYISI
jgi:hypothetical protein